MGEELTLRDLASRTGEPAERLQEWQSLGLLGIEGSKGFRREDVERARLVGLLLRHGIELEVIARAERERRLMGRFLDLIFPGGVPALYSLGEAAEIAGLPLDVARRAWQAVGEQGETLTEADIEGLRMFRVSIEAGLPEEAVLQGTRVFADSLARVAEAQTRLFHFYIHEKLRRDGVSGEELLKATDSAGNQLRPMLEPLVLFFHRKGWEKAVRDDLVLHLAEEAGLLPPPEVPGQLARAIAFVDLSSFTPLTEAMGDLEAARVLERFSELVRESTMRWDGRLVKQIGDAFMLVFPQAPSAVACALEIEARAAAEPQFPAARCGVHWGQVLYREGDYVGSNVNIAARLAAEADRHQVLVTAAVRKEAKELPGVEFARLKKRRLKGLAESLELFEARSAAAAERDKAIDPVCGMELGPAEVAARLSLEGTERAFCSEECLRRFVAAPERYGS